jgi:DNA primase
MFPIRNHRGQVIGFGGRVLGEDKPKYLNSPETPLFHKGRELYGLYEARKAVRKLERLLVVEGYMDVAALAQFDIRYAVATLGTATTPEHLDRLFQSAPEVVFCFDGDKAGRDAGWKALETALPVARDGREIRFLFLPEGEDPDSLIRKEGADAFQQRIEKASPLSSFLFDKLSLQVDMHSLAGRARLAELAKPLLARLPSGLFRQMMFKQLGQLVGVEVLEPRQTKPASKGVKRKPPGRSFLGTMPPIRRAVALLVTNPEFAAEENLPTGWEDLGLPGTNLLKELLELLRYQPNLTTAALLERWRDREEGKHLAKLAAVVLPLPQEDQKREFLDTLLSLQRQSRDRETETLLQKAAAEGLDEAGKQRLRQLLNEKAQLDNPETELD